MNIQPLGQTGAGTAQRPDLAPGPLGTAGNQRFTSQQGGAAPATPISSASGISRAWDNLHFAVDGAPQEALSRRDAASQARHNGRLIGDLLAKLRAPADDARARTMIAQELTKLSELSQGDLNQLPGGREALSVYLGELECPELVALCDGILRRPDARDAVLEQVDAVLRTQAAQVLEQVASALRLRFAQEVVPKPLWRIADLLPAPPVEARKLEGQLIKLHTSLAMLDFSGVEDRKPAVHMLDIYLQSLPQRQWKMLLSQLCFKALDDARKALLRGWCDWKAKAAVQKKQQDPSLANRELWLIELLLKVEEYEALAMLDHLRASLEREINARLQPSLTTLHIALWSAQSKLDPRAASKVLLDLNALVEGIRQTYGRLPNSLAKDVCKQLKGSLRLFRDTGNNPRGALNADSLRRLDDLTFARLRRVVKLHSLGLRLDHEAAAAVAMERVEPLSRRLIEDLKDVLRTLSAQRRDIPLLMRQLQDAAGVEWQRIQQLESLGQFVSDESSVSMRGDLALEVCERAIVELLNADQAFIVRDAMRDGALLKKLAHKYCTISYRLKGAVSGSRDRDRGETIANQLFTAHLLLSAMNNVMNQRLGGRAGSGTFRPAMGLYERLSQRVSANSADLLVSGIFYPVLRRQYRVAYDPVRGEIGLL